MKSFGLDTSIVLRLLVGAPEDQAKSALELVEDCYQKQVAVRVSDLVIPAVNISFLILQCSTKEGVLFMVQTL